MIQFEDIIIPLSLGEIHEKKHRLHLLLAALQRFLNFGKVFIRIYIPRNEDQEKKG